MKDCNYQFHRPNRHGFAIAPLSAKDRSVVEEDLCG